MEKLYIIKSEYILNGISYNVSDRSDNCEAMNELEFLQD